MAVKQRQRRRSKVEMVKILVGVDPVTKVAVKAVMEKENLTFSMAICQMAVAAGMQKKYVADQVRDLVEVKTRERMEENGWHPGLSRDLALELLTGESEKLVWN